jgi:DNA-binding transcriptional ArsR family regulator
MATRKTEGYSAEQLDLARLTKALGHPARIAIIETLARRGGCQCGELVDELPIAQATVSQHLRALRDAGLIEGEVDGPRSCYSLSPGAFSRMRSLVSDWMGACACACGCC